MGLLEIACASSMEAAPHCAEESELKFRSLCKVHTCSYSLFLFFRAILGCERVVKRSSYFEDDELFFRTIMNPPPKKYSVLRFCV